MHSPSDSSSAGIERVGSVAYWKKRGFDFLVATSGLLAVWPVILLCVVAATISTGASGLFRQQRVGLHGRVFTIYKIRTMSVTNSANTITAKNDPRITRVGFFLRRLKLDELPQLWNIVKGDMSFVGPRPDVPGYADRLEGEDRRVLNIRPGITGPATLKYADEETILSQQDDPKTYNDEVIYPDKVRLNIQYIEDWTLRGDIRYIIDTVL